LYKPTTNEKQPAPITSGHAAVDYAFQYCTTTLVAHYYDSYYEYYNDNNNCSCTSKPLKIPN